MPRQEALFQMAGPIETWLSERYPETGYRDFIGISSQLES